MINEKSPIEIHKADLTHVAGIARLLDLYRQFYECEPDIDLANRFIKARIEHNESELFIASVDGNIVGFTQLYPSFCSVDAAKIYILHDLFVDADYRKSGLGRALMEKAHDWARQNGAARVDLLTDKTNIPGQQLYESLGYKKVLESFYAYSLAVE